MNPEINLLYVHGESIGYGRYGVELARSLRNTGVDVYDGLPSPTGVESDRQSKTCNVVCWVSVPTHARGWWKGQVPVVSTMWESTRLPEGFRDTLHEFDTVIVPSMQNVELFSRYHSNVKYVPLGIDPNRWRYVKREQPTSEFRFLIGGSGSRKGTDLAAKAFRKVFKTWPKDGPTPKLIMKSPRGEEEYGERIEMVTGRISNESEVDLYASAHCYLQPSRGEGFGLQPLQAIAQGCPTILTNAHGQAEYAHLAYGIGTSMSQSAYFIYGDAGEWWEPNFDELCERMEWVYDNYDEAAEFAEQSSSVARSIWTWEDTARDFVHALGSERLTTPATVGDWYTPTERRYLIATNRDWTADIAGTQYRFEKGVDYWELADIKRILFDAGVLDPRCVQSDVGSAADLGLSPSQTEKIGAYTAANSHCPSCGQTLNTLPTRADDVLARGFVEATA